MTAIKDIYAHNCDVYLDKLCWHLAIFHDIAISTSTLQVTLVKAGLTWKILHKIASELHSDLTSRRRISILGPAEVELKMHDKKKNLDSHSFQEAL